MKSLPKPSARRDIGIAAFVALIWIPAALALDVGAGLTRQYLIGAATWACLLALLRGESRMARIQVGIVVEYATAIEYIFSDWLGAYVYRLNNVPAFVPPGHGLVYLAALALGRSEWIRARARAVTYGVLAIGAVYAASGLFLSHRSDVVGAFWYGCLALFLVRGRSPLVYAAAFGIVTYLELMGTALGTWTWSAYDPVLGSLSLGNPPSGGAGAYCFLDAAGLCLAPGIAQQLARLNLRFLPTTRRPLTPGPIEVEPANV